MQPFFMHISSEANDVFSNVKQNDIVMYNTQSNNDIHFGKSNTHDYITIGNNETIIHNPLSVKGITVENQGITIISSDNNNNNGSLITYNNNAINLLDNTVINGNLHVNGNISCAGTFPTLSDSRLKSEVKKIRRGLHTLTKLVPVKYLKDFPSRAVQYEEAGFLAQDIIDDVPELQYIVSSNMFDPYYSIHYNNLFAYIVNAIQELNGRLASLEIWGLR